MRNYYLLLAFSILLEVTGASYMKAAAGFTNGGATVMVIGCYGTAFVLYILLTRQYELGIVNALWSGVGTVLITISGIAVFQESLSFVKLFGISCIVIGVIALNLPEKHAVNLQ